MGERLIYFIFFLCCMSLGIQTLVNEMVYIRGKLIDFSDMGYFYIIPGVLIICLGFASLYFAFRKLPKNYRQNESVMKCKKCRKVFPYEDTNDGKCPNCNIDTIEIVKFYEVARKIKDERFFNPELRYKRKRRSKKTNSNKKKDLNR
ncbi:MAG: hypothetical protein CR967_04220 [Proteobacteria bacterium]|nr:MAG: hypothetical protein CR967_04220 [Pseudomonadota bacterium]